MEVAGDREAMRPKIGFRKSEHLRAGSPDTVINVLRHFVSSSSSSSASASANRSSFASDFHDPDSDAHLHLAGRASGAEKFSGLDPDPDPDKLFTVHSPTHTRNDHKDKAVQKQDSQAEEVRGDLSTDSTPLSFSLAFKGCQGTISNAYVRGETRNSTHPISVEVKSSSPRLDAVKKSSHLSCPPSAVLSPGTPSCRHLSVGMQKGWNSERMPLPHKGGWVGPSLLPLNHAKALPSKWEDAERWIFSPASGDGSHRQPVHQHQSRRKPKAKSGPLGPPGSAYYSMYTPVIPMSDRRSVGDVMAGSPFSTGLLVTNGLSALYDELGKGSPARLEPWMPRSISLHGCSVELPGQSSLSGSGDVKVDNMTDTPTNMSCPVSRRDIATQMSPADSTNSSFNRMSSAYNEEQAQSPFLKIPEVEKVTIGSLKNIHRTNQSGRSSRRVDDCTKKAAVHHSSIRGCIETASLERNEARIIAWENLQKAKAEAAIQKLEMKLEKKKASSMNKIMKKLKSAEKKAREMRKSTQLDQAAMSSNGRSSSECKARRKSSLSGCFTCQAFDLP
uniref:Remorin C-terminal domain-containing protein n=1 Tax=Kalanchoe fedtschenkoi TaxID=63787 RepID=A0A7N0UMK6_KALFE